MRATRKAITSSPDLKETFLPITQTLCLNSTPFSYGPYMGAPVFRVRTNISTPEFDEA